MGSIFRKGSSQSGQSEALSQQQADIARRQVALAEEQAGITKPLRTGTANTLSGFLQSGVTPSFLDLPQNVQPLAALSLPGLESEQQVLRNRLISQGSRGGLLQQQLAQSAIQGGIQRSGLQQQDLLRQEQRDVDRSGIARTLFGGAADLGTGGLSLAFQGLNSGMTGTAQAAQNLNQLGFQRIQQNQIAQQGIGQLLGKAMSGAATMGKGGGAAMGPAINQRAGSSIIGNVLGT
jgi:hypothetical protein